MSASTHRVAGRFLANDLRDEPERDERSDATKPVIAASNDGKAPVKPDIRHPYYEMGDKLGVLKDAIKGDSELKKDKKLVSLVTDIEKATDALHKHLEATYIWD